MKPRAQTSLPALSVAILVLATVTGIGLALGDGALAGAQRDGAERQVAASVASGFVSPHGPVSNRANVLNRSEMRSFGRAQFEAAFPVAETVDAVQVRLDETTVVATGKVDSGTTIRRLVLVEHHVERTITPNTSDDRTVTLPRRASRATITLTPPNGTTVTRVRANDRIVLRNESGLRGPFTITLSRLETTTLSFASWGRLPTGSVRITYEPPITTKGTLAVTVDD